MPPYDASTLDVQFVKGVGPKTAVLLERLGIRTVRDALYYFPSRYEDRANISPIGALAPGILQSITGTVSHVELKELGRQGALKFKGRGGKSRTLLEVTVKDGTGQIKAKWFNQPFLEKRFTVGMNVSISGVVKATKYGLEIDGPQYEPIEDDNGADHVHTSRIVPVYSTTEGLSVRLLRTIMARIIEAHIERVDDPMPQEIIERYKLPPLRDCIRFCHFPPEGASVEALNLWASQQQQALSFHELFLFELGIAALKKDSVAERGIAFKPTRALTSRLLEALPFTLTDAQSKVLGDIDRDMRGPHPMNRLLQGDVGSGKTIVALIAMLGAVECGYQAALMAPTELLAAQHYINIHRLVETLGVRIKLLQGGRKRKGDLDDIASGEAQIVVGTHALIQEGVQFKALGLAIIDEQHRFGVVQRAVLRQKGLNPDILIMTATPIPRTLALTLYGDLDYSVMRGLPPGRTPITTLLYSERDKAMVYKELQREVEGGGQAYVVYPLIEEQVEPDDKEPQRPPLKSAEEGLIGLRQLFPKLCIELIHGRMRTDEREAVMAQFKAGTVDILVATTVIEVGVDVPNASLMVIVHAERFGLAQLHQLRGRVGRGRRASRCALLSYGFSSEKARKRLDAMVRTTDGFEIAEVDLEIRGQGEFLGTRQSGMPELRVAHLVRDSLLIEPARAEAFELMRADPQLDNHRFLRAKAKEFWHGKIELYKTG